MQTINITFDFSLIDQHSLIITITGYCVVLMALAIMALLFGRLHFFQDHLSRKKSASLATTGLNEKPRPVITGEENAAIAAALYLYFSELHDEEKYVMTIRKVSKTYSPWSSKIYGIWNTMKHW
jgi:hypothetical protein